MCYQLWPQRQCNEINTAHLEKPIFKTYFKKINAICEYFESEKGFVERPLQHKNT